MGFEESMIFCILLILWRNREFLVLYATLETKRKKDGYLYKEIGNLLDSNM